MNEEFTILEIPQGDLMVSKDFESLSEPERQKEIKTAIANNQFVGQKELSGADVATQAMANLFPSAVQFGKDITYPIREPLEFAKNIYTLGKGVAELAIPGEQENEKVAKDVGRFLANRYGGMENIKKTIAQDPVGFMSDAASILTFGGTLAAKAPGQVGTIASKAVKAGEYVDPLMLAGKTAKGLGSGVAELSGKLTGGGSEALKIGVKAGQEGGKSSSTFLRNIFKKESPEVTVDKAKAGIAEMKSRKNLAYQQGMETIDSSKKIDFDNIEQAIKNELDDFFITGEKGKVLKGGKATQTKIDEINDLIKVWKADKSLHTVEGIDALKIAIDDLKPSITDKTKQAAFAVDNTKNIVKKAIIEAEPKYAKVMQDYSEAASLLDEIQKSLIGGNKASADTALRKLQSVMRNNVNTNFGAKLENFRKLDSVDDLFLSERVAGQALSSLGGRGIAGQISPYGVLATGAVDPLTGLLTALTTSPKIAGTTAYTAGLLTRPLVKDIPGIGQSITDIAQSVAPYSGPVRIESLLAQQAEQEE